MELSEVAKTRKRKQNSRNPSTGKVTQKQIANAVAEGVPPHKVAEKVTGVPHHVIEHPVMPEPVLHSPPPSPPPGPPGPARRRLGMRGKIGIATGLTAAGGTGAYLYRRNRLERSLS